jgi:hypothetical protein
MITETFILAEINTPKRGEKFRVKKSFRDHVRTDGATVTSVAVLPGVDGVTGEFTLLARWVRLTWPG